MLNWANDVVVDDARGRLDGTFGSLIRVYLTDVDSPFQELRFHTKHHYESDLRTLTKEVGAAVLANLCFRDFKRWHQRFRGPEERVARAHGLMTKVRLVMAFGAQLRLPHCRDLSEELGRMTFPMPKKRREFITAEQVIAFRKVAHERGFGSIALASRPWSRLDDRSG